VEGPFSAPAFAGEGDREAVEGPFIAALVLCIVPNRGDNAVEIVPRAE